MLFKIKNPEGKFSKGGVYDSSYNWGPKGKVWGSKAAFASHLSLSTSKNDSESEEPQSLFKRYGHCVVVEVNEETGGKREVPFKEWFAEYVQSSDKFKKIRRGNAKEAARDKQLADELHKPWGIIEHRDVIRAVANTTYIKPIKLVPKQQPSDKPTHYHLSIMNRDYALVKLEDLK